MSKHIRTAILGVCVGFLVACGAAWSGSFPPSYSPVSGGGGVSAHGDLTGVTASQHHTQTALDDAPVDGVTTEGITSNWAYDHRDVYDFNAASNTVIIGPNNQAASAFSNENTIIGNGACADCDGSSVEGILAFGYRSCGYDTVVGQYEGYETICIGLNAGKELQTTNSAVLIGVQAGLNITTGDDDVLIGYQAGKLLETVGGNSMLGYQAGQFMDGSSAGNVVIGRNAGPIAPASNYDDELYIDNTNRDDPLIWGNFTSRHVDINGQLRPSQMILPNDAAPVVNEVGEFALDTTITSHDGLLIYYQGSESMVIPAIPLADLTTTDGHIIDYNAAGSKFTMAAPGGGGDVTSVGDCLTGACLDGTSDGGTSISIYDGDSNKITISQGNIGTDLTMVLPTTDGVANDVLGTDGAGVLSWVVDDDIPDAGDYTNLTAGTNITQSPTGTLNVDDAFIQNDGDAGTGAYDFGGATGFELPNSANPTTDQTGELAIDTTSDQVRFYGSANTRVLAYEKTECAAIENLAAADTNVEIFMANQAITITGVGLHCAGTCTTGADISLEDRAGNAMTHTVPTHSTGAGNSTFQAVTAANQLAAGEGLRFDVDNAVSPETDTYLICFTYTVDAD